ncbi:Polycystin Cation Channel (PCC) Family [Thraustotheca clavata]|uniref:Polycystin Cation Channel (PCC) Family n=1 Tax=Thraustotheca clavata TaxID=74557 RepID=A0A1V9YYJ7_9STRA|nr:Polycystin Cation Channel (PCC) Family [Thraustotheca clavata]
MGLKPTESTRLLVDFEVEAHDSVLALRHDDIPLAMQARSALRFNFVVLTLRTLVLFFFATMTTCVFPTKDLYLVERGLSSALITSGSDTINDQSTMKFQNIQTKDDIMSWANDTLIPSLFDNDEWRVASENVILDLTINVTKRNVIACNVKMHDTWGSICYDNVDVGDDLTVTENLLISKHFRPLSVDGIRDAMANKQNEWMKEETAGVIFQIITYNGNLNAFARTRLTISYQSGGYIDTNGEVIVIPSNPYSVTYQKLLDFCILSYFAGTLIFLIMIFCCPKWCHVYVQAYSTVFVWLDWVVVFAVALFYMIWTIVYYEIQTYTEVTFAEKHSGTANVNSDRLQELATMMIRVRFLAITVMLLLTMRIFGAMEFHPNLNVVTTTILKSIHKLGAFSCVFILTLYGFVVAGCLSFPGTLQFSNYARGFVTCINMLFGDFDFESIAQVNFPLAVVWYFSAMALLFLILFNLLLAVVLESYNDVTMENARHNRSVLWEFWVVTREYFNLARLFGCDAESKFLRAVQAGAFDRLEFITEEDVAVRAYMSPNSAKHVMSTILLYRNTVYTPKKENDVKSITNEDMIAKIRRLEDTVQQLVFALQDKQYV